jgi:hypothetical protein
MIRSTACRLTMTIMLAFAGIISAGIVRATTATVATEEHSLVRRPANRDTGLTAPLAGTVAETTETVAFDPATMMRVADVRPGMKGYGLTVFSGIKPERFEAEVIGVAHGFFPGDDLILCMLAHPKLEGIGVVAGMSGSPVYMDGKLIGAVAYGWTNSVEPLAGVTPIESMLKVFNATLLGPVPEREGAASSLESYKRYMALRATLDPGVLAVPPTPARHDLTAERLPAAARERLGVSGGSVSLSPLATPLFLSSASPRTLALAESVLAGFSVTPLAAGAAASGGARSAEAENSPGGPVTDLNALAAELDGGYGLAVPLVEGDMSMAGVGTISFRQGDRLVAFGHPMFEFGLVNYPMAPARINSIVRNNVRPFKLGESLGQVGMVKQDRLPAIGGVFGEQARMIPLTVTVTDPAYKGSRTFHYRVWEDRDLSPRLGMVALARSIEGAGRTGGDTAALYRYSLALEDGTTISKEDYLASEAGPIIAAMAVGSDIGILLTNPYKRVRMNSVEFDIQLTDRLPQADLICVSLDKAEYRPGERARVTCEIQPYRKPRQTLEYLFTVPAQLPDGPYELNASDAVRRQMLDGSRSPGAERVTDYASLLRYLTRNYPANKIYLTIQDRDTGLSIDGHELPKLPGSVITTLQSSTDAARLAPVQGNLVLDADMVTDHEVRGMQRATFTVRRGRS